MIQNIKRNNDINFHRAAEFINRKSKSSTKRYTCSKNWNRIGLSTNSIDLYIFARRQFLSFLILNFEFFFFTYKLIYQSIKTISTRLLIRTSTSFTTINAVCCLGEIEVFQVQKYLILDLPKQSKLWGHYWFSPWWQHPQSFGEI